MAKIGIIRVKKLVDALLDYVKTDYEEKVALQTEDEDHISESFLMRCFDDDDVTEDVSYKRLAAEIFTRSKLDSRKVETRLLFDRDRATLPTIHVREPSKSKGKQDGIGYISEDVFVNLDGSYNQINRRSFDSQYELMITSMNRHEVLIMEEVLLGLLIGAQDSFTSQEPFYQMSFNVKELIANNELIPNPLYIKSIGLNVSYDKKFPDISNSETLNRILFEQNILE